MKEYFAGRLLTLKDVKINGRTGRDSAPHILNASFPGVRSEVLLHALEERGIYVSAGSACSGSACSSNHPSVAGTLAAIGLDAAHQESALRFSFNFHTTKEELDEDVPGAGGAAAGAAQIQKMLRGRYPCGGSGLAR